MEINGVTATQFRGVFRSGKAAEIGLPNLNDVNVYTEKKTDTRESEYKKASLSKRLKISREESFKMNHRGLINF